MAEPRRPSAEEQAAAQALKSKNEAELVRKRLFSAIGCASLAVVAGTIAFSGPDLVAYSLAVLGLILLLNALDAHSHLQGVRRRKALSLIPDFSVLEAPAPERSAQSATKR